MSTGFTHLQRGLWLKKSRTPWFGASLTPAPFPASPWALVKGKPGVAPRVPVTCQESFWHHFGITRPALRGRPLASLVLPSLSFSALPSPSFLPCGAPPTPSLPLSLFLNIPEEVSMAPWATPPPAVALSCAGETSPVPQRQEDSGSRQ